MASNDYDGSYAFVSTRLPNSTQDDWLADASWRCMDDPTYEFEFGTISDTDTFTQSVGGHYYPMVPEPVRQQWSPENSSASFSNQGFQSGSQYVRGQVSTSTEHAMPGYNWTNHPDGGQVHDPVSPRSDHQRNSTTPPNPSSQDPPLTNIGMVFKTNNAEQYKYVCLEPECNGKTFNRVYDLNRHHDGAHAMNAVAFWCPRQGCARSKGPGAKPFPRKDKLRDHLRQKHRVDMCVDE